MQTIRIQLAGDGEISIHSERQVSDEMALGLYRKLREVLLADGGKKRGRKVTGAASEDEASPESTPEAEA